MARGTCSRLRSAPFSIRGATDIARAIARTHRGFRTITHVALSRGLAKLSLTFGRRLLVGWASSEAPSFSVASFVYDEKDPELTIALRY